MHGVTMAAVYSTGFPAGTIGERAISVARLEQSILSRPELAVRLRHTISTRSRTRVKRTGSRQDPHEAERRDDRIGAVRFQTSTAHTWSAQARRARRCDPAAKSVFEISRPQSPTSGHISIARGTSQYDAAHAMSSVPM